MARAAKATTAKTFAECTLIAPETLAGVAVLAKLEGTEPPEDKTFVNAVASAAAFVPVVAEVTVVVSDVRETPEEGVTVVVTVNVLAAMTLTRLPLLLLLVPERKEGAKRFKTPALAEAEAAEEGETALMLARKTTFQLLISEVVRTTSRLLRTEETLTVKTTGAGVGAGVAPVTNTVGTIAQSRLTFEEERELVSMTICSRSDHVGNIEGHGGAGSDGSAKNDGELVARSRGGRSNVGGENDNRGGGRGKGVSGWESDKDGIIGDKSRDSCECKDSGCRGRCSDREPSHRNS